MKEVRRSLLGITLSTFAVLTVAGTSTSQAVMRPAEVVVQDVAGVASYEVAGTWQPLRKDMKLSQGAVIRTDGDSTVDLLLEASGTALRLTESSALRFDRLTSEPASETVISETSLTLLSGAIAGTQRKLTAPSRFKIAFPDGAAMIVGTEYFVRSDGAVSVVNGAVSVTYNAPGHKSVKVTVNAGQSFNPATGKVVSTTPDYLKHIIAHIKTTKFNAEVFKLCHATLIVKPEKVVSPIKPPGHDHDDDDGHNHDHDHDNNGHGHDNDNGHGHGDDNRHGHN